MGLGDVEFREKYPGAVYFLNSAITGICHLYELKTTVPSHDLAAWIFTVFFNEEKKEGT